MPPLELGWGTACTRGGGGGRLLRISPGQGGGRRANVDSRGGGGGGRGLSPGRGRKERGRQRSLKKWEREEEGYAEGGREQQPLEDRPTDLGLPP